MSIRMRHTRGHTGNRRSHHALKGATVVKDKETGNLRLPHRLDEATGMYRGRQIVAAKKREVAETKAKGPDTTPAHDHEHEHERAHIEHGNAEVKASKGLIGKLTGGSRPKARSGMGGGA